MLLKRQQIMIAASTITTSAGDLTLTADATNAKVVIKGDHESDVAIHSDGNADAASIFGLDAGILNIDTDGATNLTVRMVLLLYLRCHFYNYNFSR